ncbi:hypothetical protein GCM10011390_43980 [Aureimonas endophytica]|uniref:Uncharacterized protein n=1 Tax=Aureimonas endophytica TaxID=2027858 RepID=A0A916ZZC1_9HYPH|nr:hypothetical protein [Aureimonas endophytica]GGE19927.1 hypothetical protein GCM10011390_43980 [Aureimonas endophytica]
MTMPGEGLPWRERVFVTIAEAASILARSDDWIRDRIGEGRLDGRRLTRGGPVVVTVSSVVEIADQAERVVRAPTISRPQLRLVSSRS